MQPLALAAGLLGPPVGLPLLVGMAVALLATRLARSPATVPVRCQGTRR